MDLVSSKNVFFTDLIRLMKNDDFQYFYKTYFTDWNEIQSMVFFMKLYSSIEYEYKERFNENMTDDEMSSMLQQVMSNTTTRKIALQMFNDYQMTIDYQKTKDFRTLLEFKQPNTTSNLLVNN